MATATPAAAAAPKKSTRPADAGLQVVARRESFWRGGLQFGHKPRVIAFADLTPEQEALIRDEGRPGGQLVVQEVDIDTDKAAADKA